MNEAIKGAYKFQIPVCIFLHLLLAGAAMPGSVTALILTFDVSALDCTNIITNLSGLGPLIYTPGLFLLITVSEPAGPIEYM